MLGCKLAIGWAQQNVHIASPRNRASAPFLLKPQKPDAEVPVNRKPNAADILHACSPQCWAAAACSSGCEPVDEPVAMRSQLARWRQRQIARDPDPVPQVSCMEQVRAELCCKSVIRCGLSPASRVQADFSWPRETCHAVQASATPPSSISLVDCQTHII